MADKNPVAADGTVPGVDQTGDGQSVRNVVLVGHTGAGKTTLVEALLVATGTIHRAGRVEDGTTVSDHDEAELRQQRSVSLSLAPFHHQGIKVNLLDIELLTIKIRLLIVSVDKAQEMGIDWWRNDPMFSSTARELQAENQELRERLEELESGSSGGAAEGAEEGQAEQEGERG